MTEQAGLYIDPRKAETLGDKARHFIIREPGTDRHTFKVFGIFQQLTETLAMLGLNIDQLSQVIDQRVHVLLDLGGCDFQRIGRVIARQDYAIAVHDQTTVGHDRHHIDTIFICQQHIIIMFDDLQPDKARNQQRKTEKNKDADKNQAHTEEVNLTFRVLEFIHHDSGRFQADSDWTCVIFVDGATLRRE